ncbi:hypothetical protein [Clostridium sp.]|uniref:hypothetical protein n=1 Tax=Clostridium sp. TaxID=1506 RepID=UPI00283B2E39|nr:hypothetical protein [Clostridium sp.]MDR3594246.1 hypothetical protein [Clostridium sp.]
MGNIIKINLYAEFKNKKKNRLSMQSVEEVIKKYNSWLEKTNREDKIENYEKFLQVK